MEIIKNKKIKETIIQFIKFGIVGGLNTILSYGITNACYYAFHLHEQVSNLIAFVITVFISFILNGKFVFKNDIEIKEDEKQKDNNKNKGFWKPLARVYASYSITGIFLSALLLYIEEQKLGIPHYIATLMNLVITVPLNFLLNKFWAYKK